MRSPAMGFYTLGISAGIMLAYLAGGWVVENLGWREAFFIVGVPGLILAATMLLLGLGGLLIRRSVFGKRIPCRNVPACCRVGNTPAFAFISVSASSLIRKRRWSGFR